MTAVMTLPYAGETSAVELQPVNYGPASFNYFPEVRPPEPIQELVRIYNHRLEQGGAGAIFGSLAETEKAQNGLSLASTGEPSEVLVLVQKPFATDLSDSNKFQGQFLYDSLLASGVVGPDGKTPQVLQIASASRKADVPLKPREHLRLMGGDISPITDKIAEVVFEHAPRAEKIISVGYSLSGFLTPDILMSLGRDKVPIAGLIANPPGVQPEPMRKVLGKFKQAGVNATEHLKNSGLNVLQPEVLLSVAGKICEKAGVVVDVVSRPTNLSLWSAFSRGKFLERVQKLHRTQPKTEIDIALGYDDPLCSPEVLEAFLIGSPYGATVIENGDHAWGLNLPRSLGHLVTGQISKILG